MADARALSAQRRPAPNDKDLERLVGAEGWARLPPRIRERFAAGVLEAEYAGWGQFESNLAGAIFAWFAILLGRPLPTSAGAARVLIHVCVSDAGENWRRVYSFEQRAELVRSMKRPGAGAWLEECAGPLVMRLRVFEENAALVFESIDFRLHIAGLTFALPLALTPGRIRVEHHDLGPGRFAFTLQARHPWFGLTFKQRCEMRDNGAPP